MTKLPQLKREIKRRLGRLIVTITPEGIELRGYRCKKLKKFVTWQQIASLSDANGLLAVCEQKSGFHELDRLKAQTFSLRDLKITTVPLKKAES